MTSQYAIRPPVLVPLAAEIDMTTCQQLHDQLSAALACGAPVVIADFTLTTFCDCATLRCLLDIQHQAADRHAEFRVAVPLASPVRRIMQMTGLDEQLRLYPTAAHAAASRVPAPYCPPPSPLGHGRHRRPDQDTLPRLSRPASRESSS